MSLEKQLREARAAALNHLAWRLAYESRLSKRPVWALRLMRGARLVEHWETGVRRGRL